MPEMKWRKKDAREGKSSKIRKRNTSRMKRYFSFDSLSWQELKKHLEFFNIRDPPKYNEKSPGFFFCILPLTLPPLQILIDWRIRSMIWYSRQSVDHNASTHILLLDERTHDNHAERVSETRIHVLWVVQLSITPTTHARTCEHAGPVWRRALVKRWFGRPAGMPGQPVCEEACWCGAIVQWIVPVAVGGGLVAKGQRNRMPGPAMLGADSVVR